ncbi:histamine N-methyltransferase-like [Protopterus annectens]|uniref:histamine N-methyltransferase-like n=1 Tax=Protopterus annectens TaxID=7888 RepID=UPI001CF98B01|nr:histamine N-methyltransferase-like [Protopterus annectens]
MSSVNVLGIGSGTGEMDLQMLCKIQEKHPGVHINIDIVEPSADHIALFKDHVKKSQNLENVTFNWHQMTSLEFEKQIKEKHEEKTWDFIHMIEVLYYINNFEETIQFFHQHLEENGKMLIILISGNSGWAYLRKKYETSLPINNDIMKALTTHQVKDVLEKIGLKCQHYDLPSVTDITKCFTSGSQQGELLLDFVTHASNFSKTAPPDYKAEIMQFLQQPECSTIKDNQILFNSDLGAIIVEP